MSSKIVQPLRFRAYWLAGIQAVIVIIGTVIALFLGNIQAAYSICLGGLVSIIPSAYFARRLFHRVPMGGAKKLLRLFFRTEITKLVLVSVLFVAIIKLKIVADLPFIVGFVLAQLGAILLPLFYSVDANASRDRD